MKKLLKVMAWITYFIFLVLFILFFYIESNSPGELKNSLFPILILLILFPTIYFLRIKKQIKIIVLLLFVILSIGYSVFPKKCNYTNSQGYARGCDCIGFEIDGKGDVKTKCVGYIYQIHGWSDF